jgi:hypothetical protein
MTDAGMPMPALVFWIQMPTYAITQNEIFKERKQFYKRKQK